MSFNFNASSSVSGGGGGGGGGTSGPATPPVYQQFVKGAGYTLTYQLTTISNGTLSTAFDTTKIQTSRPIDVVFTDGSAVYSSTEHTNANRITATVDGSGLVTLSAIPHSSYTGDIQIHFYYLVTSPVTISNYIYNDILVTPEVTKEIFAADVKIVDAGNYFSGTNAEAALAEIGAAAVPKQEVVWVRKDPGVGEYLTINLALASITDNSVSKPYVIFVAPGVYTETTITMKPYVYIVGMGGQITIITASSTTQTTVVGCANSQIRNLQITGATGVGGKAISAANLNSVNPFLVDDIVFGNNETQLDASSSSGPSPTIVKVSRAVTGGAFNFTDGFKVSSTTPATPAILALDGTTFLDIVAPYPATLFKAVGSGAQLSASNSLARKTSSGGTALYAEDGAEMRVVGGSFRGFDYGLRATATGAGPVIRVTGVNLESNILDVNIESASASGYFTGYVSYPKISINPSSSFFITHEDLNIIVVAKRGGDFTSIAAAVDSISTSSASNPFLIQVGPGVFSEPQINCKAYVSIVGASIGTTIVEPDTNSHHVFNMVALSEISFMSIQNAGSGFAGIAVIDSGDFSQVHKVSMTNNDTHILCTSATQDTTLYLEYVDINGVYTDGIKVISTNGFLAKVNTENWYTYPDVSNTAQDHFVTGTNAVLDIRTSTFQGVGNSIGFRAENGAMCNISGVTIDGYVTGISVPNIGVSPVIHASSVTIQNCTTDINIQHPTADVHIAGYLTYSKVVNASNSFSFNYLDSSVGSLEFSSQLFMTFPDNTHTDLSTILIESATTGILEGGELSDGGGLVVNVASGHGYYETVGEILHRKDWTATTIAVPANTTSYIYFNGTGTLASSTTYPDTIFNIYLGKVVTNGSSILVVDSAGSRAEHTANRYEKMFRSALGPLYASGSIVTENTTALHLDVTSGEYYYTNNRLTPSGGTNINFYEVYGGVINAATNAIQVKYDVSGTLTVPTAGYYVKHALFINDDGANEKYLLVYSQAQYSTLLTAQGAAIPNPPDSMSDATCLIANIIVQQGFPNIVEVQDARPRPGYKAVGTSASSDHQALSNRSTASAHPQYLLRDGTNAMTANLDLGGFTITNNAALPGTTAAAPVTQTPDQANAIGSGTDKALANHIHNIPTGVPVTIGTSNVQGTAAYFSRGDHQHSHGNLGGGSTHAAVTTSVNGYMSASDKTKLDGIATGATANQTDAYLLSRANHTGTQTASTISDFNAAAVSAVGLTNVTNDLQLKAADLDIDGTLGANSDTKIPSQKAVRTYVTNAVTGLWDDRGSYDASSNLFPSTGGSGTAGAILKGDIWTISVAGTLGGNAVNIGDTVRAMIDTPAQIAANWNTSESNLGYVPVTNTRTVNGKALSSDITLQLASADFANQGTTSTVLHGNASGNPTFGQVALGSEVSGTLQAANFPALTGDVTTTAGSLATTIATNAVTAAKFRQSVARSVVGNATNATGNVTDIQGTTDQVLRVDGLGTGLSFGAIDLSKAAAATGILQSTSMPALSGDISNTAGSTVTAIGASKVTNTMLAGSIAASKLVGTDISTVGTITAGTWSADTIALNKGGTGQTTAIAAKDALTTQSTDIASAATTDLSTATGEYINITGTVTITSFGTVAAGAERVLKFAGILTLTHNGTSLILPGNTNITTAANDRAIMRSLGAGNWICINYIRASATPVSGTNTGDATITLTNDVTGSGTSTFATTIAANAVTNAKFRQSSGLSVVGVTGAATSNVADITGIANQILRVDSGGTSLAFGSIDISQPASVTGILQTTSMPALTGDVTNTAGTVATTIANNAVTSAKFRQSVAKSLVGNPGSATANVSDITGTADQVMRIDSSGTGLAFGAIDLSKPAAATGILQAASFPAQTGDVTNTAGSLANTITANAVTNAKFRQSSGLSVVGNATNGTANVADIIGTSGQVLRVSGTSLGFGAVDLSLAASATGVLQAASFPALTGNVTTTAGSLVTTIANLAVTNAMLAGSIAASKLVGTDIGTVGTIVSGIWQGTPVAAGYGGTGQSSYTLGDILYASGATTLGKLSDVAVGNALISGGVGAAPSWGKIGLTTHVSGVLPVANGGTNSSTALNNNRSIVSSGGALVEAAAAINGQILIGSTGAAPVIANITQGTGLTITNGAGSITVASIYGTAQVNSNSTARTTTTSSTYGSKTSLSTGTVDTGFTYRLDFSAILDSVTANRSFAFRIRNTTDATTLYEANPLRASAANERVPVSGFVTLTFGTTTARTLQLEWLSTDNTSTIGIQRAYLSFYRIA